MSESFSGRLASLFVLRLQSAYTSPGTGTNGDSLRRNANGRLALIKHYLNTTFCVVLLPSNDELQSKRGIPIGFRTIAQEEYGS